MVRFHIFLQRLRVIFRQVEQTQEGAKWCKGWGLRRTPELGSFQSFPDPNQVDVVPNLNQTSLMFSET